MRALYADRRMLTAGMVSHAATGLLIWFKLDNILYLWAAVAIVVVWAVRRLQMRGFNLEDGIPHSPSEIAYWEHSYIAGAGAVTLILGSMAGYSIYATHDAFAQLASVSVTLGTMVSAVGRNYASRRVVDVITVTACAPIVLGLLLLGDVYSALLAALILPFVFMIQSMSRGVRDFLYKNLLSRREIVLIADRFDAALNNMPHGLFMLDPANRIVVANRKAGELLKVDRADLLHDHSLAAVLRFATTRRILTEDQALKIAAQLSGLIRGEESRALVRFSDDLYLEFTAKRRKNLGVVLIFEDVTARIRAEEKIIHMARFDSLTGLPNRAYFGELVDGIVRRLPPHQTLAVATFDIDDFKHVNDTKGHMTGDRLLCAFASRLKDVYPERLTVSRFGGDEFVLFIRDVRDRRDVEQVMARIHEAVRGSYFVNGNRLVIGVSGGVVIATAEQFRLENMHIKADLALYESKQSDKNVWTVFARDMDEEYSRRQRLKADLREAVSNGGFNIVYQPMFSPVDMSIDCCEALSRWNHPELGPISPSVFITLAEEMGVVGELTRQILLGACRDCKSWSGDVAVSVNLSALDLRNHDVIGMVQDALDASGLPATRLQVEVTETAFVKDSSKAQAILRELRAIGLTISIDDFGTGYSSLSYLNSLPLDKVKIDRSFVAGITSDDRQLKLLRGIVHLSRELGLQIVIEGVESDEQLRVLQKTNCADFIQGFIFGLPMPSNSVSELIAMTAAKRAETLRATL
ncbi:MAG: putative bifunctional diguanylate cyclase/phosphodiesterase [Pararhizobium sp.]